MREDFVHVLFESLRFWIVANYSSFFHSSDITTFCAYKLILFSGPSLNAIQALSVGLIKGPFQDGAILSLPYLDNKTIFQILRSIKLKEKRWKHSILLCSCHGKCFFRETKILFILRRQVVCKVLAQKRNAIFCSRLRFKICISLVEIFFLCTASTVPDRRRVSYTVWFVFNPTL